MGKHSYKIEIIPAESHEFTRIEDTVSAFERLVVVNRVHAIVGLTRSEAVMAVMHIAGKRKVVYFPAYSVSPEINARIHKEYELYKYVFRPQLPHSGHYKVMYLAWLDEIATVLREVGLTPRVAILMDAALWLDPIVKLIEHAAPLMGIQHVGTWRNDYLAKDLTAELSALAAAGANIVAAGQVGPAAVPMVTQWATMRIPAVVMTKNPQIEPLKAWETFKGQCNYVLATCVAGLVPSFEPAKPFIERVQKKTGFIPDQVFKNAYDTVRFYAAAVGKAGSPDSEAVVKAAYEVQIPNAFQGMLPMRVAGKNDPVNANNLIVGPGVGDLFMQQWQDGEQHVVFPSGRSLHPVVVQEMRKVGIEGEKYEGLTYRGVRKIKLPPWMLKK